MAQGALYHGDNLEVLREHIQDQSVDLIYLDPPFNSRRDYSVDRGPLAEEPAFTDSWQWDPAADAACRRLAGEGAAGAAGSGVPERLSTLIQAMERLLGPTELLAYIVMMAERLVELRRVLKPTGTLYLHCDPTASHHLKLLLDAMFGAENFRAEIVWKRSAAHSDARQGRRMYGRIHDILLMYSRTETWRWNQLYTPHGSSYLLQKYKYVEPGTGRRYRLDNLQGPGGAAKGNPRYELLGVTRCWRYGKERMSRLCDEGRIVQTRPGAVPQYKRYLDEVRGVPLQDLWTDIDPVNSQATERLGYPTQKPVALLNRIISASSSPGDLVLDPFCGCGTTIEAAQRLGRRWIGIDAARLAIDMVERRLADLCP